MYYINTLLIHPNNLKFRNKFVNQFIKLINDVTVKLNYKHNLHIINRHLPETVKQNIKDYENSINYDKVNNEEFDKHISPLNIETLSNFLNQKYALEKIISLSQEEKEGDTHLYLIVEDDCIILNDYIQNLIELLINPSPEKWDILSLSYSSSNLNNNLTFENIRELQNILVGKEAYFINTSTAKKLLFNLETIKFSYRVQLSYFIYNNPTLKAMYPSKRIVLEGSKVGFMTSSIHENNILNYNSEFIQLFNMISGKVSMDYKQATDIYNIVKHLNSPEIMHIYGTILYKLDKVDEAYELFIKAVDTSIEQGGCINNRSELLNNAINIHGLRKNKNKSDIKSKYDTMVNFNEYN